MMLCCREEVGIAMHDHVVVKGDRTGFVRYVGHLDNVGQPSAIFVGLELEAPGEWFICG